MSCKDPGATHYMGCECHEARRDEEINKLRAALGECVRWLMTKCVCPDGDPVRPCKACDMVTRFRPLV